MNKHGVGAKKAGQPTKKPGAGAKVGGRAAKVGGRAAKVEGRPRETTLEHSSDLPPRRIEVPDFPPVVLTTPERTGRAVDNRVHAVDEAERRLRLAWYFHTDLDPALPGGASFHPRAWTALHAIRAWIETHETHGGAARARALKDVVSSLGVVRDIVRRTTTPDSTARQQLRFDVALKPDGTLLAHAGEILDAARALRAKFPALTDRVLTRAAAAITTASAADSSSRGGREAHDINRIALGDQAQLALDVLLDCVDHLGSAAVGQFLPERPIAAHYFTAPLEPHAHAPAAHPPVDPPAPQPTPAAG